MEKERQIEFAKKQQAKNQQQFQPQQSQMENDPEVNENQIKRRSEPKNPISLIRSDQNTQANPNIDLNYISPLHSTPHKPSSPHPQQHSASPSLEETLTLLRAVSPGDPRGYKEREPEAKQQKLQQYAGLMEVIEKFHEIMKPIIEEEKKKPKAMLPGQYKHYPNKDGPFFFYPPKNYRPTSIPRPKDLNLSEEQWKQFDGDVRQGGVPYLIGLIAFAAEQIVQSETESEDQEQLTNQIEKIVADRTDDNEDNNLSEHAIEPKHFTNGNDGLRKNDSGTQLQATVNGEANPEINTIKYLPTLHLTMQTDQMDSEETVVGRSYRQQPMKMDTKTTRQSITLAMKTITSKRMIIKPEDNKTIKDPTTKLNMNKVMKIINQGKQDHPTQPIPNKNQEIQTLHNPAANHLQ
ncbi:MAG: hypothetical protein EZS28_028855, partial [Streblomastix strix]